MKRRSVPVGAGFGAAVVGAAAAAWRLAGRPVAAKDIKALQRAASTHGVQVVVLSNEL